MDDQNLLSKVRSGRKRDVAAVGLDVMHELREWPVMLDVPKKIREKYQKRDRAPEPDPFVHENATLLRQQQAHDDAEAEHGNRILLFQTEADDQAEPEPITGLVALDGQE